MAKGKKTGGRKKGSRNRATAKREAEIAASGLTPLAYFLEILRNPKKKEGVRMYAASCAAPYVHPKLQSVLLTGANGAALPAPATIIIKTS